MDFFIKRPVKKTGIQFIDDNLTIITKSNTNVGKIISQEVASDFVKLNEKMSPTDILIKDNYLSIIGELVGKKVIGVETNQWIYQKDDVETLLTYGEQIINRLRNVSDLNTI